MRNALDFNAPSVVLSGLLLTGLLAVSAFASDPAADERAFLPPEQVTEAMQTAVSDTPGDVGRINIETEEGQTLVEVYVRTKESKVVEVEVDAEANEVVNYEKGEY